MDRRQQLIVIALCFALCNLYGFLYLVYAYRRKQDEFILAFLASKRSLFLRKLKLQKLRRLRRKKRSRGGVKMAETIRGGGIWLTESATQGNGKTIFD